MGARLALATSIGLGMVVPRAAAADAPAYCGGEYAEDLAALSPHARELEKQTGTYSYAVRATATYECVSYGSDGNLRRTRTSVLGYGTAFGFRRDGADTLLLTNDHVAGWPVVTDADHPVDSVPAGCKRVSDALAIVDDDHDDYAADDIPLARVVTDPALDVSILRAHATLGVIPWRIGKSSALVARDAVEVKGFPLGEFRATNVGKVISAYAHDEQGDWNHDDFVVDALLTSGGSGSPVLAVSCKTGELELVGIFHARYSNASALNVVVAIDQVRDLMTTLKVSPHPGAAGEPDATARARLVDAIHHSADPPFFELGANTASVAVRDDGTLVYSLYPGEFPRTTRPVLVLEDLPPASDSARTFGRLGTISSRADGTTRTWAPASLDAEGQAAFAHALVLFRQDALAAFDLRAATTSAGKSRDAFERAAKQRRALGHMLDTQHEAVQAIIDEVARLPAPVTAASR
jgi:serine protease Do